MANSNVMAPPIMPISLFCAVVRLSIRAAISETAWDIMLSSASVVRSASIEFAPSLRRISCTRTRPFKLARYSSSSLSRSRFLFVFRHCFILQGLGLSCSILTSLIKFRASARRYEKGNRVRFAIHAHPCEIHPARLPASIPPDAVGPCGVGLIRQDIYFPPKQVIDLHAHVSSPTNAEWQGGRVGERIRIVRMKHVWFTREFFYFLCRSRQDDHIVCPHTSPTKSTVHSANENIVIVVFMNSYRLVRVDV